MLQSNKTIGRLGEELACQFLVKKEYKILGRNYRKPWGEIDIIARASDKTLVFVEVKTMRQMPGGLGPEDQVTRAKNKKLMRVCQQCAAQNPELIDEKCGWRIDLLAIQLTSSDSENLTIYSKGCIISHYENI